MYVCRRIRLCGYLLNQGFKYVEERPDRYKEGYKVWLFDNSPELMAAVDNYYLAIKNR